MSEHLHHLLGGLEEMLKGWQLSAGALSALAGREITEGMEELTAELLLLEVGQARDELDSLELDAAAAGDELEVQEAARPGVPQGRRR